MLLFSPFCPTFLEMTPHLFRFMNTVQISYLKWLWVR